MAVFVSGFDFDTHRDAIEQHFEAVGLVSDVEVGRGTAVVRYDDPASAKKAVEQLNETTIPGNRRYIYVRLDMEKGGKKGKKGGGKDYGGKDYGGNGGRDYGGKGGRRFEDSTTYTGKFRTGTVAKFFTERGFGYITPDEGERDIFVHFSAIQSSGFRELVEGQRVTFGVEPDPKGKDRGAVRAVAVSVS
eukprot:CAMPEP_0117565530 /NCGR_PEP_ID=MMETSP0784-20121206/56616_1 /TAXON_ID=39447 /ORGANISM="" /LENGTH=189 /DNA_ID=CAMNT_0005363327 /DNA_START=31 /DNA_END=600 /DNA_ORIENTATION=-